MKVKHKIYIKGKLFKSFSDSMHYDTATPYQWCISELKELKNKLSQGNKLEIHSYSKIYNINTTEEFKFWIENIFKGGFEHFLF